MVDAIDDDDSGLLDLSVLDQVVADYGSSVPRFSATDEGLKAGFAAQIADSDVIARSVPI